MTVADFYSIGLKRMFLCEHTRVCIAIDLPEEQIEALETYAKAKGIRKKTRLKLPDAIILATARVHGLLLVTRNHRDFPKREPDIRIPY